MNAAVRALTTAGLMLSLLAGTPVYATDGSARQWQFEVFLDERAIGYHTFKLVTTERGKQLTSEARFTVRLLKIPVYRYRHEATELWRGTCLQSIEADTDDNGEALALSGQRRGDSFVLDTPAGRRTLPGCVMSFAYWNPRILQAEQLLNAQNGEYLDVEVAELGIDPVRYDERLVEARRYRLQGEDLSIDLWYSADDQWLALQSTTESGQELFYRRQTSAD